MPTHPSPRISLLGLQLGETIIISASGCIWRGSKLPDRATMAAPESRLQGATALSISHPQDVYYLAKFLEEVLQAAGQPFALRFEDVVNQRGRVMPETGDLCSYFRALLANSDFRDQHRLGEGVEEDAPKIPEIKLNPDTYYEAWFRVVPAPAQ